jgi:hypothetical protein
VTFSTNYFHKKSRAAKGKPGKRIIHDGMDYTRLAI